MTICIAAACDEGKNLVVAADRMFTVGPPLNVEFEPPISKIETMSLSCLALGSGNSLAVAEILQRARAKHANAPKQSVDIIAKEVLEEYGLLRNETVDRQVVSPTLGPDFAAFRSRGGTLPAYLQPQPQIYAQVFMQCSQFNLNAEIIIAGIDDTGSHIYLVSHPGQIACFDKIGYGVTGSGATHAAIKLALELQHPRMSLSDTLMSVYSAKLASEVAPGVGKETEMYVISPKEAWKVPDELVAALKTALDAEKASKPKSDSIGELYGRLRKDA